MTLRFKPTQVRVDVTPGVFEHAQFEKGKQLAIRVAQVARIIIAQ